MNYTLYRHLWIAYIFTVDVYFAEKLFVEKFNFLLISVTTLLLLGMSFFTMRCYASVVLAMTLCPSVCLSVRPSQVGVLLNG